MVTDSMRKRRQDDSADDHRRDRGQVILIGAITLAFIVLGVVVVFNGVLYTETLSSADTGQTASGADATELEIREGIGCIISYSGASNMSDFDDGDGKIDEFSERYGNATANSRPVVVDISAVNDKVEVKYDSNDATYTRTLEITADDCPRAVSIDNFDPNPEEDTVNWTVSSSGSDLSKVNVTFLDDGDVRQENITTDFENGTNHESWDRYDPESAEGEEDDVNKVRIVVENEAGYTLEDEKPFEEE